MYTISRRWFGLVLSLIWNIVAAARPVYTPQLLKLNGRRWLSSGPTTTTTTTLWIRLGPPTSSSSSSSSSSFASSCSSSSSRPIHDSLARTLYTSSFTYVSETRWNEKKHKQKAQGEKEDRRRSCSRTATERLVRHLINLSWISLIRWLTPSWASAEIP